MKVVVKKLHSKEAIEHDIPRSYEERLNIVEQLRLQSGKFLYKYPARFQKTVKVVRAK
jgi:hypothetical protein